MPADPPLPGLSTLNSVASAIDQFEPVTAPVADWNAAQNWSDGAPPGASLTALLVGVTAAIDPGTTLDSAIILQSATHQAALVGNGGAIAFGATNQLSIIGSAALFAEDSLINQGVIALAATASAEIVVDIGALTGLPGAAPPSFANSGIIDVGAGASLLIAGTEIENTGLIDLQGGTLDVTGGGLINPAGAVGTILLGGDAAVLLGDTMSGQIFSFAAQASATLSLSDVSLGAQLTLIGFDAADQLLLPSLPRASYTLEGSIATIIPLAPIHTQNPPCFVEGTAILTTSGPIPVESLTTHHMLITGSGAVRPIKWIGQRLIERQGRSLPAAVAPVRIHANAFGPGIPRRDLIVSPDHGIYLDKVLIPAKYLVNAATITTNRAQTRVRYFHIELATHDIILAEGLACESYLDTGNRSAFENGAVHFGRHKNWDTDAAAPLCIQGKILERVRSQLRARAEACGYSRHFVTDLAVIVDGKNVTPLPSSALTRRFALPARHGATAEIRSAQFAPAAFDPASDDWRLLGVALSGLRIGRKHFNPDALARSGFHPRDAGDPALWTDGAGIISLPPRAQSLTLELAGLPLAWRSDGPSR